MAKTKIIIALVALVAVALVVVGVASAQIAATQTPNTTTGTAPNNSFWGYMGRCFQFWANQPTSQTTGTPITPTTPPQAYSTTTPVPTGPSGYSLRGGCMARFW